MYDLRIFNATLDKSLVSRVEFPNCMDICGSVPQVRMLPLSTGQSLFEINDIIYAVTEYNNTVSGVNNVHIRDILKTTNGFGTVLIFRRGGMYADIQALHSIANRFFDVHPNGAAYRRVTRASVLEALRTCPTDKYTNLGVAPGSSFNLDLAVAIVPGTLAVTARGVFGAAINSDTDGDELAVSDKGAEAEVGDGVDVPPVNPEFSTLSSAADLSVSALSALISQLAAGKKLVFTLSLE